MKKIFIVGAGQLGSRHLQALKSVDIPLDITVIDPSGEALKTAKERYEVITGVETHQVRYLKEIPVSFDTVDIAIIASNSNVRRLIVETLLANGPVLCMVLEKLLFDRKDDFFTIRELFNSKRVKAWVNCSMRTMPFYAGLQSQFQSTPFIYSVTGSQFGLITNAIHYIDHIAYLSGDSSYVIDAHLLQAPPIESKRKGFLELNGTLTAHFSNGCLGIFTCFPNGTLPILIEITSSEVRIISKESEGKALISDRQNNWMLREVEANIPFQSQMTTRVVTDILMRGTCDLVGYDESMNLHLTLLEGVQSFINYRAEKIFDIYPFT